MKLRHSFGAFALLALGLAGALSTFDMPIGAPAAAQAASAHVLTLDVAADCRTLVAGVGRGGTNMVTGKIFPGGTLPVGTADNDPALPVNGVAPIGDWHHRSQSAVPLPPDIAAAYPSTAPVLATFYFFFDDGRALVTEAWGIIELNGIPSVPNVIVGGFGGFSGAAGDGQATIIGTNATGCPNSTGRRPLIALAEDHAGPVAGAPPAGRGESRSCGVGPLIVLEAGVTKSVETLKPS